MTLTFPQLPGLAFPVDQDFGNFDTSVQVAVSGKETRYANRIQPRRKYTVTIDGLDSASKFPGLVNLSLQQLAGFYNQCYGGALIFQFWDPDDNSISGQQFGVGDSTTTQFQLVRGSAGFVENVIAPLTPTGPSLIPSAANPNNANANVYAPNNFLTASATLATQTKSLPAGSYVLSFQGTGSVALSGGASGTLNGTGVSTRVSLAFTVASPGNVTFTVSGSVTSAQCEQSTLTTPGPYFQTLTSQYFGGPWITSAGSLVDPSAYSISNPGGVVTFTAAPGSGNALLATIPCYYWLCNFDDDKLSLSKIMNSMFEGKKISFTTRIF